MDAFPDIFSCKLYTKLELSDLDCIAAIGLSENFVGKHNIHFPINCGACLIMRVEKTECLNYPLW